MVTEATINKLKRRIYGQTFCLSQLSKVNTSVSVSQIHENNLGIQHIHRKSEDESGDHKLVKKSEFHNFQSSKLASKVPIRSMRNHRLEIGELFGENPITLDGKTTPEFEFNESAKNKCSYKAAQKPTNMMGVGFRVISGFSGLEEQNLNHVLQMRQ